MEDNKQGTIVEKKPEQVSETRRQLTRASLMAPPVITALSARRAFGANAMCLSEALSGHASDNDATRHCNLGFSPDDLTGNLAWPSNSNGNVINKDSVPLNSTAPLSCSNHEPNTGTSFDDFILASGFSIPLTVSASTDSVYTLLCNPASPQRNVIAAIMNTLLDPNYVFTATQLQSIFNGGWTTEGVGYTDLDALLEASWTTSSVFDVTP